MTEEQLNTAASLLEIGRVVETLQNNSAAGKYNDEAQAEFLRVSGELRKQLDVLEKYRFVEVSQQIDAAADRMSNAAELVKAKREELENLAKKFEVVAQVLTLVDDAITIASALKP